MDDQPTEDEGMALGLPMAGPPPERKDAARNRRRVLDAAREIVAAHGAAGFTMDAVAACAGVGKGTVFRRFGDREGLAEALIDEPVRAFQARVLSGPPPLGPGAPPAVRLEAFVTELVTLVGDHLDVALIASHAPWQRRSPALAFMTVHVEHLLRQLDLPVAPEVVARMLLGAVSAEVIADARARGAGAEEITAAARALLRGLTRPSASRDQDG